MIEMLHCVQYLALGCSKHLDCILYILQYYMPIRNYYDSGILRHILEYLNIGNITFRF